jgi:glutathione S-transferase
MVTFSPLLIRLVQRGLVPALRISSSQLAGGKQQVLTESGVIAEFLADLAPNSSLLPPSNTPDGALFRARVSFFIDTWNTKIGNFMFSLFRAQTEPEREKMSQEWVAAVKKEIEPLLADAAPFFGGQSRLTLAEVSYSLSAILNVTNAVFGRLTLRRSSFVYSLCRMPIFFRLRSREDS